MTCTLLRRLTLAALALAIVTSNNTGWSQQDSEKAAAAKNPTSAEDELDRGPIQKSGTLIGSKLVAEDGETTLGTISDLLLDLQHGHVSLAIVSRQMPDKDATRVVAIPWRSLTRIDQNVFRTNISPKAFGNLADLDQAQWETKATRSWAKSIFHDFDVTERQLPADTDESTASELLRRATKLDKTSVTDLKGTALGHLAGFAVAQRDGLLVYTALDGTEGSSGLQAIPLAAFIVKPANKNWQLDISKKALAEQPVFPDSEWPQSIERGWAEYVHVMYGKSVFEGVRSTPKPAEQKSVN